MPVVDPIEAWLADYVERRERGEDVDPDEFLKGHPEGGERLRVGLLALRRAEALFPEPDLPEAVGPYRVLAEIGRGGMGRVLKVERDGRILALKLLHVELEGQPRALERFRREGGALGRLRHDGVVRVVDSGLHGARPYLVMELVDGESLAAFVERARREGRAGTCVELPGEGPALDRVLRVMAAVARAVAAAHAAGVLHRDLNPRNVLLRPGGSPVVIDFGLVRSEDSATLTSTGDMLGTPPYMPPEQARGERVDLRGDVFGLGAILYELLTACPPRGGRETLALLREAGQRPLLPPRRRNRRLPAAVDRIVRRATSFRPAWRYPSAAELADDLERVRGGEPPRARAPGAAERALDLWLCHSRLLAALAAGLVLLAAFLIAQGRGPSRQEVERRARNAHHLAAVAWLDGDLAGMERAVSDLRGARSNDPLLGALAALAAGNAHEHLEHPAAAALLEGLRLRDAGRSGDALARLDTAANILPNMPIVLAALALSAKEAGERERARKLFEAISFYLAGSATLHRSLAELYLDAARPGDAVRAAAAAVQIDPENHALRLLLARARLLAGDLAGASSALGEAAARGAPVETVALLRSELEAAR